MKRLWIGGAAAIALSFAAAPVFAQTQAAGPALSAADLQSPRYGTWGFDLTGMDRAVKPGDDFYRFANGKWDDRTTIPADRTRFGAFDTLAILSENRTRAIVEDAAAGKVEDPDAGKIGDAYKAFMDEARIEALDARPIEAELAAVRRVATRDDMAALMGRVNSSGYSAIMSLGVSDDLKNPNRYAVYASGDGLGLPDRDYYLEARYAAQKTAYESYVAQLLGMVGWSDPAAAAKAVVAFETRLAEASWTRVQRRDRDKTYNPKTLAELEALTPGFAWKPYLASAGLTGLDRFVVTTDTAFPKFAAIYGETPIETLKAWQAFHVADSAAPYLSKRFADANYAFRGKTLAGQPEQRPRYKRGVSHVEAVLGESVGRVYVARYFPPDSKAKMDALVVDVRTALKARIEKLDWMGPETREKALDKLAKFNVKIGYPSKWRDYGALEIRPDDLYGNLERSAAYEWRRKVARLNQPVDKAEWSMTPQTVNAYYSPPRNEIVFPAAILQAPFFDPDADPAVNYGGIGGVIGHEISHGFDDQGRKSDGDGVLRDWWTADDAAKFKVQADVLGGQYSAFAPFPDAQVQGGLTMGENIGDLGGLSLGLDAYRASLKGRPAPVIDGLTGDQRVFLGWAQVWRQKIRDEALRQRLATDPHSPALYRVNGTIRNIPGWYAAFDVKPGEALYVAPEQRVRIW